VRLDFFHLHERAKLPASRMRACVKTKAWSKVRFQSDATLLWRCLPALRPYGKDRANRRRIPCFANSLAARRCRSSVVEHPLGKGEVVSSILPGSTILAHHLTCRRTLSDRPEKPRIVHHERSAGETILTRIVSEGTIKLDPPGLEIEMADIYAA
jgi:hypothetical protein